MQPVNPYLRAFFRSALPSQCHPINHHVLLVPTTDSLLHGKDRDTNAVFADVVGTEDFLASHVLRVPGGQPSGTKEGSNVREAKSKAKQYTTINARTIVIKESFVYSNKGFKSLNQAQLLGDAIYYPDLPDNQQWLIYYISKPLLGTFEAIPVVPATLKTSQDREQERQKHDSAARKEGSAANGAKKDIKSFGDILNEFPRIAGWMQGGLERSFKDLKDQFERPPSKRASRPPSVSSQRSSASLQDSLATLRSSLSGSDTLRPTLATLDPEEDALRTALEHATNSAIEEFQKLDEQQLSSLASSTSLSNLDVEQMIERFVAEQLHERILFPRICNIRREEDLELESRMRKMANIDVAQVGIPIEGGRQGKRGLALRLDEGVAVFKRLGVAGSPHEMIEVLLSTAKVITTGKSGRANDNEAEKQALAMTMNADTLVSMLLIVVIRSSVRYLNARLSYMRNFVFSEEVELGETGYALSTFEAVLTYLATDSDPLRRASRSNAQLWEAVAKGDLNTVKTTLEPARFWPDHIINEEPSIDRHLQDADDYTEDARTVHRDSFSRPRSSSTVGEGFAAVGGSLTHVFPFQQPPTPPPEEIEAPRRKRVSMAVVPRSASMSSDLSSRSHSRRQSTNSATSNSASTDMTLETLAQTQNTKGDSIILMAVDAGFRPVVEYLLTLEEFYPVDFVLDDCNNEGTSLLSAALQGGDRRLTRLLLAYILKHAPSPDAIRLYVGKQDSKGRSVAHYIFNQPSLLDEIGLLLPWRLRDKNGQTPLFAICRSYDHADYHWMVSRGLALATEVQGDGEPLHLDDHIDSKGNTLLHIVNDAKLTAQLLKHADADVNAVNDRRFTPLMVASKYGKMDCVRALFQDPRVELAVRDLRGLSAIELAKDDDIRNCIDDMVLLSTPAAEDGRITTVVRSYFVEDATVRLILKSGAANGDASMTVTTCRRSVKDFEDLSKWLSLEQPASWLPTQFSLPSPFIIPSKPSRAALRDIQVRLDNFLRNLLTHATFSTHELVWEFFLVPDIEPSQLAERSKRKAEIRAENVRDDYIPITNTAEVELFVQHAQDQVKRLSHSTKGLIRRTNRQRQMVADYSDLAGFSSTALSAITFLPEQHKKAFERFHRTFLPTETNPLTNWYYHLHSISSSSAALLVALSRPSQLISRIASSQSQISKTLSNLSRQSRWTPNIGFFDDTRRSLQEEAEKERSRIQQHVETLGSELRYTQQTVAAEMAGWQEEHVKAGRRMLRNLAQGQIVHERRRLEGMKRAIRELKK